MTPKIVIIENNTLSAMALKGLLWEIFPQVEVVSLGCVEQMMQFKGSVETEESIEFTGEKSADGFVVHWFVNSSIIFSNSRMFEPIKASVIVLTTGPNRLFSDAGYKVLDISLPEKELARAILMLHHTGHPKGHSAMNIHTEPGENTASAKAGAMGEEEEEKQLSPVEKLSARERDVLVFMVKGLLNKEIASELNISLPTVVFHRNNIYEKLGSRSIGKLTIMAVIHNLIPVSEI